MTPQETAITIAFVHFRTTTLDHLDAAWFSLSKQDDWTDVVDVIVLDNNTDDAPVEIDAVLDRYPLLPCLPRLFVEKHGDPSRTHSWSVNRALLYATTPWVFFTRTDFLLDPSCLRTFRETRDQRLARNPQWDGLITSWCHQMGFDATLSNTDALAPHSMREAPWRQHPSGPRSLIGHVPACHFHDADKDAGVWLTRHSLWARSGGLNERMVSWGYQQSVWQTKLVNRFAAEMVQIPDYLFHHQHHAAPRDPQQAAAEVQRWGHA